MANQENNSLTPIGNENPTPETLNTQDFPRLSTLLSPNNVQYILYKQFYSSKHYPSSSHIKLRPTNNVNVVTTNNDVDESNNAVKGSHLIHGRESNTYYNS